MKTFGAWYNPITWFDSEPADVSSSVGYSGTNLDKDPFGWDFEDWLGGGASTGTITGGQSDADVQAWQSYLASGGTMVPQPPNSATTSTDLFGGITDFFSDLTRNLPSLVGLGLNTWQSVEAILAQQERAEGVSDRLVFLPGTQTPIVQRTQGGNTTYARISDLYPSLAPQVQQTRQTNQLLGIAMLGAVGVGLVLLFRKK